MYMNSHPRESHMSWSSKMGWQIVKSTCIFAHPACTLANCCHAEKDAFFCLRGAWRPQATQVLRKCPRICGWHPCNKGGLFHQTYPHYLWNCKVSQNGWGDGSVPLASWALARTRQLFPSRWSEHWWRCLKGTSLCKDDRWSRMAYQSWAGFFHLNLLKWEP